MSQSRNDNATSRRAFLKSSTAAVGASLAANLRISRGAYAGGSDVIRIALVGCGGRGSLFD